jgi:hypothetical protein
LAKSSISSEREREGETRMIEIENVIAIETKSKSEAATGDLVH